MPNQSLWERDESEWSDEELLTELVERYKPTEVPPCRVCGKELTLQSAGGGQPTVWACDNFGQDWEHYSNSRWEDYKQGGDVAVMELISRYRKVGQK